MASTKAKAKSATTEPAPLPVAVCIVCGQVAKWLTQPGQDEDAPLIYACDGDLPVMLRRQYTGDVMVTAIEEA